MSIKATQQSLQREIEGVKTQRLQIKLATERQGLMTDRVNLDKAKVTTEIAVEGLGQERIKLGTTRINTSSLLVAQQAAQQSLNTAQTKLELQRYKDQGTLQLQTLDVADLRLQISHRLALVGNPSSEAPQLS